MLLLARHGETDDNVPPLRFQGQRDTPLNERGRTQARALAERVAALDPPVSSLWASDLSRARETADIVGARIGLEPRLDARLREGWRGEWEGFLFEQIERADPERYAAWRAPDAEIGFRFPGGESLAEQQARVLAALGEIARETSPAGDPLAVAGGRNAESPGDPLAVAGGRNAASAGDPLAVAGGRNAASALVICHGGSIRAVLCRDDPRGLAAFHDFEVPNVALVPVELAALR
ncbi:MAG TPA: histidine phosphatase family protein [Conexibacter sp.]|jgi:broad specificity phosphatase PhoE|nr:histidine phosphatase family protein [Conexibacter sp.]